MLCIGIVATSLGLLLLVGSDRSFQIHTRHEAYQPTASPRRQRGEELLG
ncbi:hypothetical protein [Azospirillum sp.]|nr:hypothetical protein [Azospirillum sp.]HYF89238.1 hypothetical protein [Azospirillum sp.]